jgi:spore germination cell wall hydrolase CwlJ-like protein
MRGQSPRDGTARRGSKAARSRFGRRALASFALALTCAPLMPTAPAMPEMSAAAGLNAALAVAGVPDATRLAVASIVPDGARTLYIHDAAGNVLADRGGRVAPGRRPAIQAHFAAGRVGDPAGLLRPGIAIGDSEMRTALAGPQRWDGPVQLAGNFRSPAARAASPAVAAEAPVQVAAVETRGTPAPVPNAAEAGALETLAAYAAAPAPSVPSLFDAVLGAKPDGFVPPLGKGDHSWAATALPASAFTPEEQTCLATGIYFEARGETEQGQAAVAQVILNRVRNPTYPKTICGVVYQNASWRNRCQFSFACDGIKDVIWNKRAYATAERIADQVTTGETWLPEVGSATHYHATYVHPRWARAMKQVDKIGLHIFYRTFGGGWN